MAMIRKNILHKLARETRQSIFDDVLAMDPNGSCPTLLIALVNDKYYDEAVCRYKKFNQAVTPSNEKEFRAMKMKDLLHIKHLRILHPGPIAYHPHRPPLTGNKIHLKNDLSTITMECFNGATLEDVNLGRLEFLIIASRRGITKVTISSPVRTITETSSRSDRCAVGLEVFNLAKLEYTLGVPCNVVLKGSSKLWIFEAEKHTTLRFKRDGRT